MIFVYSYFLYSFYFIFFFPTVVQMSTSMEPLAEIWDSNDNDSNEESADDDYNQEDEDIFL